ncbi:MAG: PTS transporter subunit EIIA [bacterium]|nr:PTS transporter subunit EIIA [bacterium]
MEKATKKKLSAKDVASLLQIPLVKVQRWVHQGTIPCKYDKNNDYYFKQNEITQWAQEHNFSIAPQKGATETEDETDTEHFNLYNSIKRAGVFHKLPGDDIFSVLKNAIDKIEFPPTAQKDLILDEIIFRESIASTGIGNGVAIPHLKDVQHLKLEAPIIPVFFLEQAIDYNSIDGQPVSALFFIFTPSPECHLKILSRLSYCLHGSEFRGLLKDGADAERLLAQIDKIEKKLDID